MLDLKALVGQRYKITMETSYQHGGDRPKEHYYQVQGRRGDVMAWDDDTFEVTVYGRKLPEAPPGVLRDKHHNLSLPLKMEKLGWPVKHYYDDSMVFLLPKERILEACQVIKAVKVRQLSPAQRQHLASLSARFGFKKRNASQEGVRQS